MTDTPWNQEGEEEVDAERESIKDEANGSPYSRYAEGQDKREADPPRIIFGEEIAKPLPPIDWLCEGLKLTAGVTNIAGETSAGKSIILGAMCVQIALGADIFGVYRCRQGRALYLNWDGMSERLSRERLQRLARPYGVGTLDKLGKAIGYGHKPNFFLDDKNVLEVLLRLFDGVAFAVLDSWRGATRLTDEWRRAEVQPIGAMLEAVSAKTGTVIKMVDHEIKPAREKKGAARKLIHETHGSTAKGEVAQAAFSIQVGADKTYRTVHHTKERVRGRLLSPFDLYVEDIAENGTAVAGAEWGLRVRHGDPEQRPKAAEGDDPSDDFARLKAKILKVWAKEPTLSGNAICGRVGGTRTKVLQAVKELRDAGQAPSEAHE
jgi:hypothetical protein